jgi:hypothetical protein
MDTFYNLIGIILFFSIFKKYYYEFIEENYKFIALYILGVYGYLFGYLHYDLISLENYSIICIGLILVALLL